MTRIDRLRRRVAEAPAKPRKADIRRTSILDAAARLFIERGVDRTTVDEIARTVGLGKGTFYHYFEGKLDLIPALREQFGQNYMTHLADAVAACREDDWEGRLRAWLVAATDQYFRTYQLHDVVFHSANAPLREAMGDIPVVHELADLLEEGEAAGAWQVGDARSVALLMFRGLHGMADEAIVLRQPTREIGPAIAELFLRMIKK